jgi:hypothetical protein
VTTETARRICWSVVVTSGASIVVLAWDSALRLFSARELPGLVALLALLIGAFPPQIAFAWVLAGGRPDVMPIGSQRGEDGWTVSLTLAMLASVLPGLPPEGRVESRIVAFVVMLSALLLLIGRMRQLRRIGRDAPDVDGVSSAPGP